ncbi:MAG: hypothetical protein F4056_09985 [Chloroflexi bacterium]|nr:hypothetical protein [Chloroflexota bacterium]
MRAQGCKFGSSFLRRGCGRRAVSECVYCTRPFCDAHGERGEDYMHVCAGRRCRARFEDLREQTEWRARVAASNTRNECAIEGCQERMGPGCSRCRLQFCQDHVRPPDIRDRSLASTFDKIIQGRALLTVASLPAGRPEKLLPAVGGPDLICAHCAERPRRSS